MSYQPIQCDGRPLYELSDNTLFCAPNRFVLDWVRDKYPTISMDYQHILRMRDAPQLRFEGEQSPLRKR